MSYAPTFRQQCLQPKPIAHHYFIAPNGLVTFARYTLPRALDILSLMSVSLSALDVRHEGKRARNICAIFLLVLEYSGCLFFL